MGVLPAVFPDARQITSYVAGVMLRIFERRGEEENQPLEAAHQAMIHSGHGARRPARFGRTTYDSPGLRDRVDLAFRVFSGAQRGPIIKVSAAIPFTVPAIAFQRCLQS